MLDILIKFGHLRRSLSLCLPVRIYVPCSIISIINVVEAHYYAFHCRWIDCEQICSRINQQLIVGCFGHEGAAYKTFCTQLTKTFGSKYPALDLTLDVLYAADKGLRGRNILQLVVDWFCYVFAHNQFAYISIIVIIVHKVQHRMLSKVHTFIRMYDKCLNSNQGYYNGWNYIVVELPIGVHQYHSPPLGTTSLQSDRINQNWTELNTRKCHEYTIPHSLLCTYVHTYM